MSQINSKSTFINFYDAFWMCFWFSAVLGIVYIALFHFFPKVMVRAILILGFITFIVTGFLVILYLQFYSACLTASYHFALSWASL